MPLRHLEGPISDAPDADIDNLQDDDLLQYNSSTEKWENVAASTLAGGADTDARTNILAGTPSDGDLAYSTDENRFYVGLNSSWYVQPVPQLLDNDSTPNIGLQEGFVTNYNSTYITNLDLANCNIDSCIVRDSDQGSNGMLRAVDLGNSQSQFQFYSDGAWRALLTGIQLQEDNDLVLEFQPFGTDLWIETHTGNSNATGLNGRPIVQNYEIDIGAFPARRIYTGRYFDGTNFVEW